MIPLWEQFGQDWDKLRRKVIREFEKIQTALRDFGDHNPLVLERDPPECGAVYVLLHDNAGLVFVRVTVRDKPNLLPQIEGDEREYPSPLFFDPEFQDLEFIGWKRRGGPAKLVTTEDVVTIILKLAMKA